MREPRAVALHRLDAAAREIARERHMSDRSIEVPPGRAGRVDRGASDEEITRGVEERGVEGVLDDVFPGHGGGVSCRQDGRPEAIVQYDVTVAGAPHTYQLKIAGGKCEVSEGPGRRAARHPTLALPDFLAWSPASCFRSRPS